MDVDDEGLRIRLQKLEDKGYISIGLIINIFLQRGRKLF